MNRPGRRGGVLASLVVGMACVASAAQAYGGMAMTGVPDVHSPDYDPPFHGGIVVELEGELHYEVVVLPSGELQIWFSDLHRRPMAAAEVTDVAAEVDHADKSVEPVDMHISNDGNYWTGTAHLKGPSDIVRVGFVYQQVPTGANIMYASFLAVAKTEHDHGDAHE